MEATAIKIKPLKEIFDKINNVHVLKTHIKNDPIEFPHLYQYPKDVELAGFIASALSFGNIKAFKPVIRKILSFSKGSLYDYVINFNPEREAKYFDGLYYRMCKGRDIAGLIFILREIIRKYGTIGNLFNNCYFHIDETPSPHPSPFRGEGNTKNPLSPQGRGMGEGREMGEGGLSNVTIRGGLQRFIAHLRQIDTTPVYGERVCPRGLLQMLPSPENGGPCKRLNMYLRWMVRPADGVDFGLWKRIPPSVLVIPLDTHIFKICRGLNMTFRKNMSWKMAEEITDRFRLLSPEDPLKYDFALCHLGISKKWKEVLIDGDEGDTTRL